ncbi:MAG TPA: hypothetical protein VJH68_03075 [Candidatus Nanoarchaeia archaeon]|nr:hypothetical protein [Candidatus Nanoarchaeia archaeon]
MTEQPLTGHIPEEHHSKGQLSKEQPSTEKLPEEHHSKGQLSKEQPSTKKLPEEQLSTERLSKLQLALLILLYSLLALMLIFSIQARKNIGQDGYDRCIEEKCQQSQRYCEKPREIENCCSGAAGKRVLSSEGKYTCSFS